jgi:hypothetical protein
MVKLARLAVLALMVIAMVGLLAGCAAANTDGSSIDPWTQAYMAASTLVAVAGIIKAFKMAPAWAEKAIDTAANFDAEKINQLKDKLCSVEARTTTAKAVIIDYSIRQKWGLTPETIDNLVDVISPLARRLKMKLR